MRVTAASATTTASQWYRSDCRLDEAVPGSLQDHDLAVLAHALQNDLSVADEVHAARAAPRLEQPRAAVQAPRLALRVQGGWEQRLEIRGQAIVFCPHMIEIICVIRQAQRHSRFSHPFPR